MKIIEPTIEEIKKDVFAQLEGIDASKVVLFTSEKDDELVENYTLVFFPEGEAVNAMEDEVAKLEIIQNDLFYLDRNKWHMTMIGEIGMTVSQDKVIKVIKDELKNIKIDFMVSGFASNKTTGSVLAYPNFKLHKFRENVREKLDMAGTDYTTHLSVYEFMGWINFVRYTSIPRLNFFELMRQKKDMNFGNITSGKLKLLKNRSRTLRDGEFEVVYEF